MDTTGGSPSCSPTTVASITSALYRSSNRRLDASAIEASALGFKREFAGNATGSVPTLPKQCAGHETNKRESDWRGSPEIAKALSCLAMRRHPPPEARPVKTSAAKG
jgi:hypothetical protein